MPDENVINLLKLTHSHYAKRIGANQMCNVSYKIDIDESARVYTMSTLQTLNLCNFCRARIGRTKCTL